MVSIIIRTKNEERWISLCLDAVFSQSYRDFEVIVVDNRSTDKTREKAESFGVKLITIDEFRPGKAINLGVRHSSGEILVCLSGHCIPVNKSWLQNLIRNLDDPDVAGVYGRQEPMSFSSDRDKRDLLTVFGLDKRIQVRDSFFHNANSAFRRDIWDRYPFDEEITNIEDRVWGQQIISQGFQIVYEPEASVYHYHGIHHDGDPVLRRNVVRILETLVIPNQSREGAALFGNVDVGSLNAMALIPAKGGGEKCGSRLLIEYTIERALQSRYISDVIVLTDEQETLEVAQKVGAQTPFLRPPELSKDFVGIAEVLQYSLNRLEAMSYLPDICIVLEKTYPFRPPGFIDELIENFVRGGADSLIPVRAEHRSIWLRDGEDVKVISPLMPRSLKTEQVFISLFGLGFVTYPKFIRDGSLGLNNLGMYEVTSNYALLEVRDSASIEFAAGILEKYWQEKP